MRPRWCKAKGSALWHSNLSGFDWFLSCSSDVLLPRRGGLHCLTMNCMKFLILQATRPHFSFLLLSLFSFSPSKLDFLDKLGYVCRSPCPSPWLR